MSNTPRSRRAAPSTSRSATVKMQLETLEDRVVPSTSIPLTSSGFRDIGPSPISPTELRPNTLAPGELNTAGRVVDLAVDPTNRNILYASTGDGGIVRSLDGGVTWATPTLLQEDDPNTPQVDPKFIYNHLTDNLSVETRITANGADLGTISDNDRFRILKGGAIAVNPRNVNNIFAGLGNPNFTNFQFAGEGLLISNDAGLTWRLEQGPGRVFRGAAFQKIEFIRDPATGQDYVFALINNNGIYGTTPINALYRSSDNGVTWVNITQNISATPNNPVSPFFTFSDFSIDPSNPNVAYVAVGEIGEVGSTGSADATYQFNGVYRTSNAATEQLGGALNPDASQISYQVLLGGNSVQIPGRSLALVRTAVVPQNPSTVYVASLDFAGNFLALYRSRNSGTDIVEVQGINAATFGAANRAFDMLIDPTTGAQTTRIYFSGARGVAVVDIPEAATNPVATTQNISIDTAGDGPFNNIYRLTFDRPLVPNMAFGDTRLIASTDGGVYRLNTPVPFPQVTTPVLDWESINGAPGPHWRSVLTQFLGGGLPVQDDDRYFGGVLNNGNPIFSDPGGIPRPSNADLYSWPLGNAVLQGGDVYWDFRDVDANGQLNTLYQVTTNQAQSDSEIDRRRGDVHSGGQRDCLPRSDFYRLLES